MAFPPKAAQVDDFAAIDHSGNAPPALGWAASLLGRMLPAEDRAKVRLYDSGGGVNGAAAFEAALLQLVDAEQAPRCFGGRAAWPFSVGGDVPVGALATLRARLDLDLDLDLAAREAVPRRGGGRGAARLMEQRARPASLKHGAPGKAASDGSGRGGKALDRFVGAVRQLVECVDACSGAGAKQVGKGEGRNILCANHRISAGRGANLIAPPPWPRSIARWRCRRTCGSG